MSHPDSATLPPILAAPGDPARRTQMRGIALLLAAIFTFTLMDATAKHLTESYHPAQLVWVRFVSNLALVLLVVRGALPRTLRTKRPKVQIMRAVTGGAGVPSAAALGLIATASVVGTGAYYALTSAMRLGEVAVVTPFRYTRLVFALILAALVFGERPDLLTLLGSAVIVGSGVYTLLRSRRETQTAAAQEI